MTKKATISRGKKWTLLLPLYKGEPNTITAINTQYDKYLSMFNYRFLRQQIQNAIFIAMTLQT
jgi:hypothetical protein